MVARRAHNPEAVGSNPAPATKKSHPRQNASGLLISTYPSDCNGSGDLATGAGECSQVHSDSVKTGSMSNCGWT